MVKSMMHILKTMVLNEMGERFVKTIRYNNIKEISKLKKQIVVIKQ